MYFAKKYGWWALLKKLILRVFLKKFSTIALSLVLLLAASAAQTQNFSDAEIKAAYIFKLAKFVSWSGGRPAQIQVCYVESSRASEDASVGQNLERLILAKNAGSSWAIKRLRGLEGLGKCHMLFIADTEESSLSSILSQTTDKDILTMSDARRFIYKGGMLGFVLDEENRVKMEANLNNLKKTNVMIGAAVLELMQDVIR